MSFGTARYLKRQKNTNIFFSSEMNFFYNLHVSLALHPQLTSPYPVENFLQSLKEIDRMNYIPCHRKCFTYVIKTIENLTTYSRKPGDYNGTIIFEIDIMKNSFWRNWKIAKMALMNPCMKFVIVSAVFCWAKWSVILVLTVAKNVNFKLSGDEFFMMSISKIMVPL